MSEPGFGKRFDTGDDGLSELGEETKKAIKKAMALLMHKDRTAKELMDRLQGAGFEAEDCRIAFEYVDGYGYINDVRYAESYISFHKNEKSRSEIRRKLKEKGISDTDLQQAFESYSEDGDDPEDKALDTLITKRLKGREISELTYEEKQKQMRYLAGKGFPADKIRKRIRERT